MFPLIKGGGLAAARGPWGDVLQNGRIARRGWLLPHPPMPDFSNIQLFAFVILPISIGVAAWAIVLLTERWQR